MALRQLSCQNICPTTNVTNRCVWNTTSTTTTASENANEFFSVKHDEVRSIFENTRNTAASVNGIEKSQQQLPSLIHNVCIWLNRWNITYYDIVRLPISTIRPSNVTMPLPFQSDDDHPLYLVRFVWWTTTWTNPTAVMTKTDAMTTTNATTTTTTEHWLLLHLIPSPTSLQTCIPAGVTQYMTNHPDRVWCSSCGTNTSTTTSATGTAIGYHTVPQEKIQSSMRTTIPMLDPTITTTMTNISTSQDRSIQIIHLHEDIWNDNRTKSIVQSRLLFRLKALISMNSNTISTGGGGDRRHNDDPDHHHQQQQQQHRRLYARQTTVCRIDRHTARDFLWQHHLWGSTTSTKYSYGLYDNTMKRSNVNNNTKGKVDDDDDPLRHTTKYGTLVAVATFSSRRNVRRGQGLNQRIYRSHELLRTCTCRNVSIVGGISKLISAFIKDHNVDDIVTVIDRDWGIGQTNWYTLGFTTVATMLPIPMVIHGTDRTRRRHLIGAGIIQYDDDLEIDVKNMDTPFIRFGLPRSIVSELETISSYAEAIQCLHRHNYYLTYDAGVERLFLLVSKKDDQECVQSLWNSSIPQYAKHHYSYVQGIDAIIQHVAKQSYFL